MPITDATAIQEHTQLSEKASGKVAKFASMAEKRLRQLITGAKYDEIAGDENHADFDVLQQAESLMSLYYGFQFLNLRATTLGGFSKVIGYGSDSSEILMSSGELRKYKSATYEMAVNLLDDIRDVLPEDEAEFEKVDPGVYDAGAFKIG